MNNFARLAVLTYRGAFVSWQGPGYVTRIFFQPLLHVLAVVLAGKFAGSPQAAEHYTIGLLAFSIIFVIAFGILEALFYDRAYGILSIMFLSPANRLMVYFGRAGIHWLNAIVTFAIGLVGAWLILGLDLSAVDWASLLVTIAVMISFLHDVCLVDRQCYPGSLPIRLRVPVRVRRGDAAHRRHHPGGQAAGHLESSQPSHTFHPRNRRASRFIRRRWNRRHRRSTTAGARDRSRLRRRRVCTVSADGARDKASRQSGASV